MSQWGVWLAGRTEAGRTVWIPDDPYLSGGGPVFIDGEKAVVLDVSRLRDGGTTEIRTDRGDVWWPRRHGAPPERRIPQLDGDPLEPILEDLRSRA